MDLLGGRSLHTDVSRDYCSQKFRRSHRLCRISPFVQCYSIGILDFFLDPLVVLKGM